MSGLVLARPLLGERTSRSPGSRTSAWSGSEALRLRRPTPSRAGPMTSRWRLGVEKLKDSGLQGAYAFPVPSDGTKPERHCRRHVLHDRPCLRQALRHRGGPGEAGSGADRLEERCPEWRAESAGAVPQGDPECRAAACLCPRIAGELSVFDCAGVADGAAAAVVVRAEDAHRYTDTRSYVKALSFIVGDGSGCERPRLRLHDVPRGGASRRRRPTRQAGHHRPAAPSWRWRRCTTVSRRPSSC